MRAQLEHISKSIQELEGKTDLGKPYFSSKNYKAIDFSQEHFREIKNTNRDAKLCFIDGGNQEIASAANFSLHACRVYYGIFEKSKRINQHAESFFTLTTAEPRNGTIYYVSKVIPMRDSEYLPSDFEIDSSDHSITIGGHMAKINSLGGVMRKLAEWTIINRALQELNAGDVVVKDGTLQLTITGEEQYAGPIMEQCIDKGVALTGLAKTSNLFTTTGLPLFYAINKLSSSGEKWCYNPICEISSLKHEVEMCAVKLHEASGYVFRFEISKQQESQLHNVVSLLADNAKDPSFIGYPYGLIDADKQAKGPNDEIKAAKALLGAYNSGLMRSVDAHDLLNRL